MYFLRYKLKCAQSQKLKIQKFVWPDLATCHYANSNLEFLENERLPYVKKLENPLNAPQIRPIDGVCSSKRFMKEIGALRTEIS